MQGADGFTGSRIKDVLAFGACTGYFYAIDEVLYFVSHGILLGRYLVDEVWGGQGKA